MSRKLPSVTSDIPRDLRQFIDRVREILSGNTADRYVTAREIVQSGAADVGPGGALVAPDVKKKSETPAQPQNFTAAGALQNIILTWDNPNYVGHAHAEIYRSATDDVYTGTLIGTAPGRIFTDAVGYEQSYFYWIRFVNDLGVAGPYFSATGVFAQTGVEVARLLDVLTGQITESQLFTDLGTKINSIDSFGTDITDLTTLTNNTATTVQTLSSTVAGNTTSVQTLSTTVDGISGAYTVKIDNNGYVTGFGLASTANDATPFSEFAVRADRFYVASPSGPGITPIIPFVVNTTTQTVNGVTVPAGVYMDAAYIKNGTITNAKIGNASIDNAKIASLSADKITAGTISSDRLDANVINAKVTNIDAAVIGSGTINSARIGNLSADSITSGTLSAARISSGTAEVGSGKTFALGSSEVINGIQATGIFTRSIFAPAGFAVAGLNSGYGGGAAGVAGASTGLVAGTYGVIGYYTTASYSSSYGVGVIGSSGWGAVGNYYGGGSAGGTPLYEGRLGGNGVAVQAVQQATTKAFNLVQSDWLAVAYRNNAPIVALGQDASPNYCIFSWPGKGQAYFSDGVKPFTGVHDGVVESSFAAEVGDILVDEQFLHAVDVSNAIVKMRKSTSANQKGVIGVFTEKYDDVPFNWKPTVPKYPDPSTKNPLAAEPPPLEEPEEILQVPNPEYYDIQDYKVVNVNALGEGMINVCGEGGDIEIGDLIVTSSIPGKGMKQADDLVRNITVAKSRQNVAFSGPTEVKQIACIYMCG